MYGFNNYNAYTSYLTPQGYSPSNYIQNQLGLPNAQQLMQQQQMMPQQPIQPQPQQFFAQPSGQLFSINSAEELANIPVQEGAISAIINPNENMLYLKSMQNGRPFVLDYQLKSSTAQSPQQKTSSDISSTPMGGGVPKAEHPIVEKVDDVEVLKSQITELNNTITSMSTRIEELENKTKTPVEEKKINTKKMGE